MSFAKEVKLKIRGIKQTQKITSAMEMVAASKMRRAQEHMLRARPYADKIQRVINHIASGHSEYQHPFMKKPLNSKKAYIIVASDRGLCGGLNTKLFKELLNLIKIDRENQTEVAFCPIGKKAENFFKRYGGEILAQAAYLGGSPQKESLIGTIKILLDAYLAGSIGALFLCSNRFISTMVQKPFTQSLLPIVSMPSETKKPHWDYIYEPDEARSILTLLLTRHIESQIYRAVVENFACEQAARMLAMKNATSNAKQAIQDLQLVYNKARQAAITRELAEIVAGAAAV